MASTASYYLTLAFLQTIDFIIFALNFILSPFPAGRVVPHQFSPGSPPHFFDRPGPWFLCVAAGWLGKGQAPNWLWNWATYPGLGAGGDWGEPVRPNLGKDKDSRSPCPAIKSVAVG